MFSRSLRAETRSRAKEDLRRVNKSSERVRRWEKKWIALKDSSMLVFKWVPCTIQDHPKKTNFSTSVPVAPSPGAVSRPFNGTTLPTESDTKSDNEVIPIQNGIAPTQSPSDAVSESKIIDIPEVPVPQNNKPILNSSPNEDSSLSKLEEKTFDEASSDKEALRPNKGML
ncbi:unnamed protein product [Protopolystoma xenopodis]|uniref:Uncharacterized protein n=1 Tax=Protopolystoma xenopodis TaxID=117903 RepID=A0A448XPP8_9PLAT|nr:unnamed protein product [Protopolystoma xenopodis]